MGSSPSQPATKPNWKKLQDDYWEGQLQNLNDDLRLDIIHYGKMTAAIVDLFDMRPIPKEDFFEKARLVKGNTRKYEVKAYIETKLRDDTAEWIGYVAVSNDEATKAMGRRDIFVGWRGTRTRDEWIKNLKIVAKTDTMLFKDISTEIKVHTGFYNAYTDGGPSYKNFISPRDQVRAAISSILDGENYKTEKISITVGGFSLGGAIATLNAMDLVVNGFNKNTTGNKECSVTAFTFGAPSAFIKNGGLDKLLESQSLEKLRILRITNPRDPVPKHPFWYYSQVPLNNELKVDHTKSIFLKGSREGRALEDLPEIPNPPAGDGDTNREGRGLFNDSETSNWFEKWFDAEQYFRAHSMDVYMHGVKIHGKEKDKDRHQYHDIALVNKYLDLLKVDYGIPPNWWHQNGPIGNMVQDGKGNWSC